MSFELQASSVQPWVAALFWAALSVPIYTYAVYPILIVLASWFVRRPECANVDEQDLPSISIILAAHNEATTIQRKLENCLTLDYPADKTEILVGSDGSDDRTDEIVETYLSESRIRLFPYSRQGKMATVNRLVQEAKNEICVFSDISEEFDSDAPRQLVRHFADPDVGAVTGKHVYHKRDTGIGRGTAFYWKFRRMLQQAESHVSSVCTCDGTIYSCRRESFPYPPDDMIDDDMAVPLAILGNGKRIVFESSAIARGDVLEKTSQFFRQKVRGQAGRYQIFVRYPSIFVLWPPVRWWVLMSHMVTPVLVPWSLVVALVSNLWLLTTGSPTYQIAILFQLLLYGAAFCGLIGELVQRRIPFTSLPFYFVTANVASLVGAFAFITGKQNAAWRSVD